MKNSLLTLLISLLSISVWGAEISKWQRDCIDGDDDPYWCNAPLWSIKGAIEKGDYEKLKSALEKDLIKKIEWLSNQRLNPLNESEDSLRAMYVFGFIWRPTIGIYSEGGDVIESLKIGRLIRQLRMDVSLRSSTPSKFDQKCLSACVNILIAGLNGLTSAPGPDNRGVGVHRPSFNDEYFAGLSSSEAETLYLKYENEVKAYMTEMGASQGLINLTFNTPSSDIHMLRQTKFGSPVVTHSSVAWWEERVDANCSRWESKYDKYFEVCATMLQVKDTLYAAKEYFK